MSNDLKARLRKTMGKRFQYTGPANDNPRIRKVSDLNSNYDLTAAEIADIIGDDRELETIVNVPLPELVIKEDEEAELLSLADLERLNRTVKERFDRLGSEVQRLAVKRYSASDIEKVEMKARMMSLYALNESASDIADTINKEFAPYGMKVVDAGQVRSQVKSRISYWEEKTNQSVAHKRAAVLARLDQLENLAMLAYFDSTSGKRTISYENVQKKMRSKDKAKAIALAIKEDIERAEREGVTWKPEEFGELPKLIEQMNDGIKELIKTEMSESGDPRWVSLMLEISKERAKLWNLYKDIETSNADQELARMPDDVRENRIAALLQNAKSRSGTLHTNLANTGPLRLTEGDKDNPTENDIEEEDKE